MTIGVAGPYSADTAEQRQKNLDAMNDVAARLLEMGHVPIIGVNAALPVVDRVISPDKYQAIMDISMAIIDTCDAILMIGDSPGANREKELVASKGLPVYYSFEDIPKVPDAETVDYILGYFSKLMTLTESQAMKHAITEMKAPNPSDSRKKMQEKMGWTSTDKTVLALLKNGYIPFRAKVAERILIYHSDQVFFNNCPKCGKLARTPQAKQCRHCGHDWH